MGVHMELPVTISLALPTGRRWGIKISWKFVAIWVINVKYCICTHADGDMQWVAYQKQPTNNKIWYYSPSYRLNTHVLLSSNSFFIHVCLLFITVLQKLLMWAVCAISGLFVQLVLFLVNGLRWLTLTQVTNPRLIPASAAGPYNV